MASEGRIGLRQTGPVTMPLFLFDDDPDMRRGFKWSSEMLRRGVYAGTPWHNMFSVRGDDHRPITRLQALDAAERLVRRRFRRDLDLAGADREDFSSFPGRSGKESRTLP